MSSLEAGEVSKAAARVDSAADDLAAMARPVLASECLLAPMIASALVAVRQFGEEVATIEVEPVDGA